MRIIGDTLQTEDQPTPRDLLMIANELSECSIDPKYYPLMFESPVILESLNYIYSLHRNQKISLEDTQEIKKISIKF